jgi:hypothetical protein
VSADAGFFFHEVDFVTGVSDVEGGLDACDSSSDNEDSGFDGDLFLLKGFKFCGTCNGHFDEIFGFFEGGFFFVGVDPRAVFSDVRHVKKEGIQPDTFQDASKGGFVEGGTTGGYDYTV